MGYDVNPERAERLVATLESPLDDLPPAFGSELAGLAEIPLDDLRRQEAASRRFVEEAEGFYRRLLDGR